MNRQNQKRLALGIAAGTGIIVPMVVALILFLLQDNAPTRDDADMLGSSSASPLVSRQTPDADGGSIMLDAGATLMLAQSAGAESFATLGGGTARVGAAGISAQAGGSNGIGSSRNRPTYSTRARRTGSGAGAPLFASAGGGGARGSSAIGTNGSGATGSSGTAGRDGSAGTGGGSGAGGGSGPSGSDNGDTTKTPPTHDNSSPGAGNPASSTPEEAPTGTVGAVDTPPGSSGNPGVGGNSGSAPTSGGDGNPGGTPTAGGNGDTASAPPTPPSGAPNENGAPGGQGPVVLGPFPPPGAIGDPQVFSPTVFAPATTQAVHTVPEPGALGLVFAALVGLGLTRRTRKRGQ